MFDLRGNRCARRSFLAVVLCIVFFIVFLNHSKSNAFLKKPPTQVVMEKIQLERKNLLKQKCRELIMESETSPIPAWFKIEDGHQVMYCDVPKAASTNLKRLMLILSGKFDIADLLSIPGTVVHHQNIMRNLAVFESATFSENGVGNYTKFIFVRHPFERLVSAYENKVGINAVDFNYRKRLGPKMIRKYRQEPTKVWEEGDYATFVEFVDYVIEEWKLKKTHMDVHWLPANDLCIPCTIEYDLIGKVETLEQDVSFLLHKLNETDLIAPFQAQQNAPQTTPSVWRQMMKQLSQQQIYDLLTIYAADFHMFGYLPDYQL